MSSNWLNLLKKQNAEKNKYSPKSKNNSKNSKSSKSVVITNKTSSNKIIPRTSLIKLANEKLKKQQDAAIESSKKMKSIDDKLSNKQKEIGRYLAIDCEFVGVGPDGIQSELARVSIVNFFGHLIYDKYVKPREKVTDWRTFVSGIRPSDMHNAIPFDKAQSEVADLLKDKILVGHAIHHDLEALYLTHPKSLIRDTATHTPFKQKYSKGKTPSLKKLATEILGWNIQTGEHSSVEDAKATMLIYKSDKKNFDDKIRTSHHHYK
ncbi:3'-5' exonuclease [Pichia californica]|uniref:RNA exonuclease 4 n=1 Tax=Pichia californica TaxID=460514 RepID=A0A9P6WKQ0_9ASCO|nr:3'-5' exonuclease [[Candida] californica]KAG0688855.1 3'-5' exonuclease [[Candida] californica]